MQDTVSSALRSRLSWRSLLADTVLVGLVSGPLAAPFLAASGIPLLGMIAAIIYTMGEHVCPQPEMGLVLADPYPMAVCMRCYGTVLGLVAMRYRFSRDQGQGVYWLEQYGLAGFAIAFIICLAYPLELALQGFSFWSVNPLIMTCFGLIAGLGLGAYIMPLLYASSGDTAV